MDDQVEIKLPPAYTDLFNPGTGFYEGWTKYCLSIEIYWKWIENLFVKPIFLEKN